METETLYLFKWKEPKRHAKKLGRADSPRQEYYVLKITENDDDVRVKLIPNMGLESLGVLVRGKYSREAEVLNEVPRSALLGRSHSLDPNRRLIEKEVVRKYSGLRVFSDEDIKDAHLEEIMNGED